MFARLERDSTRVALQPRLWLDNSAGTAGLHVCSHAGTLIMCAHYCTAWWVSQVLVTLPTLRYGLFPPSLGSAPVTSAGQSSAEAGCACEQRGLT